MKIVVIGGTGLIGSNVVEKLKQRGHEVLAAAPSTGVNTITGEGLKAATAGAQVVIDLANSPSFEDKAALDLPASMFTRRQLLPVCASLLAGRSRGNAGALRPQQPAWKPCWPG